LKQEREGRMPPRVLGGSTLVDKNSLWDELNIQKRELYVKKKKITRYGVLSQAILGRPGQRAFGVGLG